MQRTRGHCHLRGPPPLANLETHLKILRYRQTPEGNEASVRLAKMEYMLFQWVEVHLSSQTVKQVETYLTICGEWDIDVDVTHRKERTDGGGGNGCKPVVLFVINGCRIQVAEMRMLQ